MARRKTPSAEEAERIAAAEAQHLAAARREATRDKEKAVGDGAGRCHCDGAAVR